MRDRFAASSSRPFDWLGSVSPGNVISVTVGSEGPQIFATTHWSVVLAAGSDQSNGTCEAARAALDALCRTYWPPVYAYIRARSDGIGEAEDLTQEFFYRLLHGGYLTQVDPRKGRFRSFLFAAIQHFLSNARDHVRAVKRGGRIAFVSLDDLTSELAIHLHPSTDETPETIYERRWVATILASVLGRLRAEFTTNGEEVLFEILKRFLTGSKANGSYAEAATGLGVTEASLKMRVQRLRRRYGELIRAEIRRTLADPAEVEDEMRHLLRVSAD